MKLLQALKKGIYVRRQCWKPFYKDSPESTWHRREGVNLVDQYGHMYQLDFSDFESTDWEIQSKRSKK